MRFLTVFLVLLAVTGHTVFAATEPRTGIRFDDRIKSATLEKLGVRTKGPFKVYAVGQYSDDSFVLKMNMGVGAAKMSSALADALKPRCKDVTKIAEFESLLLSGLPNGAKKGTTLAFATRGGKLSVSINDKKIGAVSSKSLAMAFVNIYTDFKAVCTLYPVNDEDDDVSRPTVGAKVGIFLLLLIQTMFQSPSVAVVLTILLGLGLFPAFSLRIRRILSSCMARGRVARLIQQHHDDYAKVTGLFIYPVKSMRVTSVDSAKLDERGLVGDRRFMVVKPNLPPLHESIPVDATHSFLTQRQCPTLATIDTTLQDTSSTLTLSKGKQKLNVDLEEVIRLGQQVRARIWTDVVDVLDCGDDAASFLESIVKEQGVRLVALDTVDTRMADDTYVPPEARSWTGGTPLVALSDGFPVLVACTASLCELNLRLTKKGKNAIPMSRFRPNIVIETSVAFEEDEWKVIQIGDTVLHLVKGCPRCKQSCTDQVTGEVSDEPLVTLSEFRATGQGKEDFYFAQNAVPHSVGTTLTVGATVKVLEWGDPVWDRGEVQQD